MLNRVRYILWGLVFFGAVARALGIPPAASQSVKTAVQSQFDLSTAFTDPSGAATLTINNLKSGSPVEIPPGNDAVTYGDELQVNVTLPANEGAESWYRVKSVEVTMDGVPVTGTLSNSGLSYSYTLSQPVTGDIAVTAELERKRQDLVLLVEPANGMYGIEWRCDTLPGGAWTAPVRFAPADPGVAQMTVSLPV
ncbi:MAG: hypothetical protein LBR65_02370, partial [Culturomica sp.]|nr:hypothetical protein [Culturomica sp.]